MSETVVLQLRDDITRPAREAHKSLDVIFKDLSKLKNLKIGGGSNGINKQISNITTQAKAAQSAMKGLHSTMGKSTSSRGFTSSVTGINKIASAAAKATAAVQRMNRNLGGGNQGGGSGGGGGRGGSGRGHGGFGHFGRSVGSAFMHVGVYEAVERGIHATAETVKTGMEQAFELQHTKVMLAMQGETKGNIDAAVAQARSMTKSLPQFTSAQNLEAIAELRPALLGGLQEATKLAPMFQQAVSVLEAVKQGAGKKALAGVDSHGEALDLVRALEIKGETGRFGKDDAKNEVNMDRYVNGMTKAIVAFNGQIKAGDFHSAFKYSRGASNTWTQGFATEVLPTLMNELKKSSKADASQTGNALQSMYAAVVDNVMTPTRLANWDKLGMYAPGALKRTKNGPKVNPGEHMIGYQQFMSDPYSFMQDVLLPHMKAKGIDVGNREAVVAQMGGLFGNRVAKQIAVILATQQAIIEKDRDNIKKAMGTNGLNFLLGADPTTRMKVLAAAFKDLGGAIGEIALPGAMRGLKGLIDFAHGAADAVRKSEYGKTLGGHFDALMAGIFGQGRGRKGLANGADKNYFESGKALSAGFGRLMSGWGKILADLEQAGLITGSLTALGSALKGLASIAETTAIAMEAIGPVMRDGVEGISIALHSVADAFSGFVQWMKGAFSWAFPSVDDGGTKKAIDKAHDSVLLPRGLTGLRAASKGSPYGPLVESGDNFGIKPIADSAASATPMFAQAGQTAMSALASGLSAGSGQATGSMSALMGTLAGIAAAGVTVPVKLDMAAAEAQLSGLMAKAGRIGSARPQFSPALSDIGH